MKRFIKNEKSFLGKVESLIRVLWEQESIRFVFVGGINTVLGIVVSIFTRYIFIDSNLLIKFSFWFMEFDIPNLVSFVVLLPVAYTMQALIAFRSKWEWKRLAVYPLTSIPNLLLQQTGIYLFTKWTGNADLSYILAAIAILPIMFFIIRFFVKPLKNRRSVSVEKVDTSSKESEEEK